MEKNNDVANTVIVVGFGIIIFLFLRRRNNNIQSGNRIPQTTAGTQFINDPVQSAYSPSLAPQLLGGNVNVDIQNQGLNYLSNKYIPLFGFVGMAQGETFH